MEILREVLVLLTHLLGAEHKSTLSSANNQAASLSNFGQAAECEQILRGTLALSWCALGPTHTFTQSAL